MRLYDATILNEDEKMARFHVDHFFKEMGSIDLVVASIQRADGWNQAMRDAALSYAQSRASIRPVSRRDSAAAVHSQAGNLLVNGSFEAGPGVDSFLPLDKGSDAIKGWRVTRGQIDYIERDWKAADGQRSLDLHGSPGHGGIEQTFKTKKGERYRVTFSLAGNPGSEVPVKRIAVSAAGKSHEFIFDSTGKTADNMGWVTKEWEFNADAEETSLEIRTLETMDPFRGPALDNVRVVAISRVGTAPPLNVTRKNRPARRVFVPAPHDVVKAMLVLAKVKKSDVVFDLGSGDGRILIAAAKDYGCKAIGYEIDPELVALSRQQAKTDGVERLVTIHMADVFTADLAGADVVTLYLLPQQNEKLAPQLKKLKPGSRVVSHQFEIPGMKPEKTLVVESKESGEKHTLFLYLFPLR
jgi:choice-of-anchor C domain-containing protein